MGIVTDTLVELLTRQVNSNGLVVWFDPDRQYVDAAAVLTLDGVQVTLYEDSFFRLRHDVDQFLNGETPPRLLVYVPLAEEDTSYALAELTSAGVVLKPGAPGIRNTGLAVIAGKALRHKLGGEQMDALERQIKAGALNLADLDALDEQRGGSAVIAALFGTTAPDKVALAFVKRVEMDDVIVQRQALDDLTATLAAHFGLPPARRADPPHVLRRSLAMHTFSIEILEAFSTEAPQALQSFVPPNAAQRAACVAFVRAWRNERDAAESYVLQADGVEAQLGLASLAPAPFDALCALETCASLERALQAQVEARLMQQPDLAIDDAMTKLSAKREAGFWALQRSDIGDRWRLITLAGRLLKHAGRIELELKELPAHVSPDALLGAYARVGDTAWCLLDTMNRNLERVYHGLESEAASAESATALLARARQRYAQVAGLLAERFARALEAVRFSLPNVMRQRDVFEQMIRPALHKGRTAYVLVDAMRFEMARELYASLRGEFQAELVVAVGTLPGVTPIGMAALMPDAGAETATLVTASDGALALRVGGVMLKDRKSRMLYVEQRAGVPTTTANLEQLLPKPSTALERELKNATLAVITSQEIDATGEKSPNLGLAREMMDVMLRNLARLARVLQRLGYTQIVFTADHGHLFGERLEESMKLDPPGGETIYLGRRIWVGRGGAQSPHMLRVTLAQLGLRGDLDLVTPIGFGVFKVAGGSEAFFHGGASLQELAIPILSLTAGASASASSARFEIKPTARKLSTHVYTVRVDGKWTGMFPPASQRVRLELRQNKESISSVLDATYGLDELAQEVELRSSAQEKSIVDPVYITLRLVGKPEGRTATLVLIDAVTGMELARLDKIEVVILDL